MGLRCGRRGDDIRCRGRLGLRRRDGGNGPTLLNVGETLFEGTYAITCTDRDYQTCDCDDGEGQHQKYCQSNFHNGLPIRLSRADASRLRVLAKVGCSGLWSGSKGLDVFFLMWGEPHQARVLTVVAHLTDSVCRRQPNQPRNDDVFQRQVWISQEPHNDLNRTTPGTNLLPSINHAQRAVVTDTTSVQRRQYGLGMG